MTVLIDAWAWIEYFKGSRAGAKARPFIEGPDEALVSAANLSEVYRWLVKEWDEPTAEDYRNVIRGRARIVPVDEATAVAAALARGAHGLGLGDSFAFATARAHGARILTGDPDFKDLAEVIYIGAG